MGQGDPGDQDDLSKLLHLEHKEYPNSKSTLISWAR